MFRAFVLAAFLPVAAMAQHYTIQTAGDLVDACSIGIELSAADENARSARAHRARCRNYLSGFIQASVYAQEGTGMTSPYSPSGEALYCYALPDELSFDEMESLVTAYATNHPDSLDQPAANYLVEVFSATYPCE